MGTFCLGTYGKKIFPHMPGSSEIHTERTLVTFVRAEDNSVILATAVTK
jgi:hypothetical protein